MTHCLTPLSGVKSSKSGSLGTVTEHVEKKVSKVKYDASRRKDTLFEKRKPPMGRRNVGVSQSGEFRAARGPF
ncbi:hypothetical protein AVEN_246715-1 [Araneus ventricosus]|uniref:Uncharacterized protein n=1 Tax=Araneus ventricosus TaxID=182803 RepID=A0A4Y2T679_ARAVE|nr:hypothetical protein AVEN_212061-1 [Araneus ventricosus]GBN95697.1 hypothetical protein AVEN_246715-1 [Araneus ventricosus]